ncbi:MAG: DUF721 domain-containing protein [Phycisphaerales bacterium]|jgi:hypothetical protein
MFEDEQLRNTVMKRRARKFDGTVRLGDIAGQFVNEQISPRQSKYSAISELWSKLLPAELQRCCEIVDISGGQLKVRVDSPVYQYELQLCSSKLLEQLQQQCPKARLTKIKFVIA